MVPYYLTVGTLRTINVLTVRKVSDALNAAEVIESRPFPLETKIEGNDKDDDDLGYRVVKSVVAFPRYDESPTETTNCNAAF